MASPTAVTPASVRRAPVVAGAAIAVFVLGAIVLDGKAARAWSDIGTLLGSTTCMVVLTIVATGLRGRARVAWGLLAGAMACWSLGDLIWSVLELGTNDEVPFPSVADGFYLAFYPLAVAGLLTMPSLPGDRTGRLRILADGAVFGLGMAALLVPAVIDPALKQGPGMEAALLVLYPVLDAVLVIVALNAPSKITEGRPWAALLVAGFALVVVGDLSFAMLVANGSYESGAAFDVAWLAGSALIAYGGIVRRSMPAEEADADTGGPPRFVHIIPVLPVAGMIAYGLVLQQTKGAVSNGYIWAVCATGAMLMLRQVLIHFENLDLMRALHEGRAHLRHVLDTANDPYIEVDGHGAVSEWNQQAERVFGWHRDDILGQRLEDTVLPERRRHRRAGSEVGGRPFDGASTSHEAIALRRDGSEVPVEVTVWATERAMHLFVRDIRDRKFAEDKLMHQATHDSLTGLPNRMQVIEGVNQRLRGGQPAALLLLDLDGFKDVNDTLGHDAGDRLLIDVARRLAGSMRTDDLVARLGGDEFAVLTGMPASIERAFRTANEMLEALGRPFEVDDVVLYVRASIGIAVSGPGATPNDLLRRADVAMYRAKRLGTGAALHTEDDDDAPQRLSMAAELKQAIQASAISVSYQPKVELRTGAVVGVEALARWNREGMPSVPPTVFVPLAEQTGLMHELTELVLRQSIDACSRWRAEGFEIGVAVNVGAVVIREPEFAHLVSRLLLEHRIPPGALTLEITETALADTAEHALGTLRDLTSLGVRVTIDDFGTGYSSMTYLKRLPIAELKIDKSFVVDIAHDDRDQAIVGAMIEVARRLDIDAVAEGVENQATHDALVALGCQYAQGYLYGKAVPLSELIGTMAERAAAP